MSISSVTSRINYTGNGATSVYAYTFRIVDEDDLLVTVRDTDGNETTLVKTTDYTVSGVGVGAGGNVTLVNASQAWLTSGNLTTDYVLSIRRVVALTQTTDIRNQGDFYPEAHEDAFDKSRMIDLQQQDELDRSIKLPESIDPADFDCTLPADIADEPGSFIQVNADGDGFQLIDALSDSEVAIETGTGVMVRTGASNAVLRTITGTASEITVTNGNGVSANPEIGITAGAVTTAKLNDGVFHGLTGVTADASDYVPLADASDSNNKKKALVSTLRQTNVRSVSSTDSTVASDNVILLSGASFTLTLHTAVGNSGQVLDIIHNGTSLTQVYTLGTTGGQTIGGVAGGSYLLYTNSERLRLVSDNSNWQILTHQAVTTWASAGALTVTATGTPCAKGTTSTDAFRWRRNGRNVEFMYDYVQTAGGTAGTGAYIWTLPSNLTIDTTVITTNGSSITTLAANAIGIGVMSNQSNVSGATTVPAKIIPYSSTEFLICGQMNLSGADGREFRIMGATTTGIIVSTVNFGSTNKNFWIQGQYPVSGWQP